MELFTEQPHALKQAALIPPRIALGSTMAYHGLAKLRPAGTSEHVPFFESIGIHPARPWVLATGAAELFAGLSMIAGFASRLGALAVLVTQGVAIAKVHGRKGFEVTKGGYEFSLALCAIALSILMRGPGRFSAHAALEHRVKGFGLLPRGRRRAKWLDVIG